MKVGVLIELFKDTNIDERFAELRSMGMESCQLVCWNREIIRDDSVAEAVNSAVEKHGVHITAFWCGWEGRRVWDFYEGQLTLGLVPTDYRVERVKMLMEGVDFAKKIHAVDFATHVGYMPENPYDPKYQEVLTACKAIVAKCKENGQNFLFETGQETPVTLKRAIQDIEKDLGKGNVGINLDPANLIMYGKANPVDALEVFGEYVRGIHGKDLIQQERLCEGHLACRQLLAFVEAQADVDLPKRQQQVPIRRFKPPFLLRLCLVCDCSADNFYRRYRLLYSFLLDC